MLPRFDKPNSVLNQFFRFSPKSKISFTKLTNSKDTWNSTMARREGDMAAVKVAQIPTSFGHELRACRRCHLVKTYDQFRSSGCENCAFFQMQDDHERVADCTTHNFTGLISVMDPSRTWAARWLRIGKFIPGCYTLAVSEALPDELQIVCENEGVPYVPPKEV